MPIPLVGRSNQVDRVAKVRFILRAVRETLAVGVEAAALPSVSTPPAIGEMLLMELYAEVLRDAADAGGEVGPKREALVRSNMKRMGEKIASLAELPVEQWNQSFAETNAKRRIEAAESPKPDAWPPDVGEVDRG